MGKNDPKYPGGYNIGETSGQSFVPLREDIDSQRSGFQTRSYICLSLMDREPY